MTANLPAHLQGRQQRQLVDNALAGIAGALPPHVSIASNRFTLVDAAGGKKPVETLHLDCCIIDVADTLAKQYYELEYEPDAGDPPTCWSPNGIAPSRESTKVQARTCAECQWNVRGSDTSKISGKPIKACRDEKWLALVVPGMGEMLFQLKVTPGSFKNWKAYVERCKSQGVDMSLLTTRLAFDTEGGKTGILTFAPVQWIDAVIADIRDKAWSAKATDALVGRGEQPVALTGGTGSGAIATVTIAQPIVAIGPFDVPNAGFQSTLAAPAQTQTASPAPAASPSEGRRKRRTKAEMEAERNGQAQPNGQAPVQQTAPFRPDPAPQPGPFGAAPAQATFGIQQPQQPPAELNKALDDFFGALK